ncbi:alpha/beta fold hydrolase [Streptomyces rishiriensis]|uniref:alpha/beta fold hydrolase n=1 Tax=Streptomyces rishiriensis TaxID=68264 RepID=UPI000D59C4BF|nr:alpha/beta fold hydrolase [Streptomyces rishiriensis]
MPQRVLIAGTSPLLAGRLAARCLAATDSAAGADVVLLSAPGSRPGAPAPDRHELAAFVARCRTGAPTPSGHGPRPGGAPAGPPHDALDEGRLTVVCVEPDAVARELKAWTADQVWCVTPGWDPSPARGTRADSALAGTLLAALPGLGARRYVHVGPETTPDEGRAHRSYRDLERLAVETCLDAGVSWRVLRTAPAMDDRAPVLGECPPGAHRLLWALHSVRTEVEDRVPDWFERHPLRVAGVAGLGLTLLTAEQAAGELWRAGAPGELPDGFATVPRPAPVPLADVLARAGAVHGIDVRPVPDREDFGAADRLLDLRLADVRRQAVRLRDAAPAHTDSRPARAAGAAGSAGPARPTGSDSDAERSATTGIDAAGIDAAGTDAAEVASPAAPSVSAGAAPCSPQRSATPSAAAPQGGPAADAAPPPHSPTSTNTPATGTPRSPAGPAAVPAHAADAAPAPLSAAGQWELFGAVRAHQALPERTQGGTALRHRVLEVAGRPLVLFEGGAGEGPPLLVLNALGQGPGFLTRLCAHLAPYHRVVTWQVRGTEREDPAWGIRHQLDDMTAVLEAVGAERAHVLGWCTGAKIATAFQQHSPLSVASLVFLNATFRQNGRWDGMDTKYESDLAAVCRALDRRPDKAARMLDLLAPGAAGGKGSPGAQDAGVLGVLSGALADEVRRPFRDAEVLVRYARQLVDLWRLDSAAQAPRVAVPALFVCSEFDGISSPARAREAARCFPHARYAELAVAGHYAPHDRPALVAELITEFVRAPEEVADLVRYAEITWHIDMEGTAR